jgi:xanthine dehydrogenase accessory factor
VDDRGLQQTAAQLEAWRAKGTRAVFARVVELQGFSTWSGDELVAVNEAGERRGDILGRYGAGRVAEAAADVLAGPGTLFRLAIEVHGSRVADAGLSCGGQADLLLQPAEAVPEELWAALAARAPVALLTRIDGPGAGPAGTAVHPDGTWQGGLGDPATPPGAGLVAAAVEALRSGNTMTRRLDDPTGAVLADIWVPSPRVVVVGAGELVGAIAAQASLLGWETRATDALTEVDGLLAWGGASTALVVLSHDPHVDAPALAAGLAAGAAYVGAMGSRRTQSRRIERLRAAGVTDAALERIHRPIGLDLGGRSAAEVALSIGAEILAVRCGRDGRPLAERQGAINDRPTVSA